MKERKARTSTYLNEDTYKKTRLSESVSIHDSKTKPRHSYPAQYTPTRPQTTTSHQKRVVNTTPHHTSPPLPSKKRKGTETTETSRCNGRTQRPSPTKPPTQPLHLTTHINTNPGTTARYYTLSKIPSVNKQIPWRAKAGCFRAGQQEKEKNREFASQKIPGAD